MKTVWMAAALSAALGGSALAADISARTYTKAPTAIVAPAYDWSGLYVGVHGGGGWGKSDWLFMTAQTATSHNIDGGLGGFQAGYNFQSGAFVFGIEGEYSFADIKGSSLCPDPTYTCSTKAKGIGDVAGRVGYAADRALFYVKGGGAWVEDRYDAVRPTPANTATGTETRAGWLAGIGVEYAFAQNWTVKGEVDYVGLGSNRVSRTATNGLASQDIEVNQSLYMTKVGVNYKFGGPVLAKY